MPRCGYNCQETHQSTQHSASTSETTTDPTRPDEVYSCPEVFVAPIIDAPIIFAIPPPSTTTANAKNAGTTLFSEDSDGHKSSNKTMIGSAALHAQTPTPLFAPIDPGLAASNKLEVTQAHTFSLQTKSSHPIVQIHPLLHGVVATVVESKRERIGPACSRESFPDDFRRVSDLVPSMVGRLCRKY